MMSFLAPAYAPARANAYNETQMTSRVEGATPHELVSIMFEELLLKLDSAMAHIRRGDTAGMLQARAKAAAIVNALDESLDFERGGDTAIALGVIYREAAQRIAQAQGPAALDIFQSVREMISEIFSAWSDIGQAAKAV